MEVSQLPRVHDAHFVLSCLSVDCKWKFPNCLECTMFNCIRCRDGYYKVMTGFGIRCMRTCPKGMVVDDDECVRGSPVPGLL